MIGARRKPMPWEEEGQLGRVDQALPSELLPYPEDPPAPPLPPMADPNVLAPAPPKRPDALSRAESASRNNRFIAALANFGASMLGGGSEAVSLEQAGKGPIDAYQRRQDATKRKQQEALAALAGSRKEAEEQRKIAAAGREDEKLGFARDKAGREGAKYDQTQALDDYRSPESQDARERLRTSNKDIVKALGPAFERMSVNQLSDDKYISQQLQLARQKDFADYTEEAKLRRAHAVGGLKYTGAPGATVESPSGPPVYAEPVEMLRAPVRAMFPKGYLENDPEGQKVATSINSLTGRDFRRGSLYGRAAQSIQQAAKRAEDEQRLVVPGWVRAPDLGYPEISPAEAAKARKASASLNAIRSAVDKLEEIRDEMTATPGETLRTAGSVLTGGALQSDLVGDAQGLHESIMANVRVINEYGAPQDFEMKRLTSFMPEAFTMQNLVSGKARYRGMYKGLVNQLGAQMESKGYKREAARPWQ